MKVVYDPLLGEYRCIIDSDSKTVYDQQWANIRVNDGGVSRIFFDYFSGRMMTNMAMNSYTPRTIAFMTVIGIPDDGTIYFSGTQFEITGHAMWVAVNTYDLFLISSGIETKKKAVYLMIGGTATSCKYNFMNPLNTDAAFRLTFSGGWTFGGGGATGNGINGFADTFFVNGRDDSPSGFSSHLCFYSRTQGTALDTTVEMGVFEPGAFNQIAVRYLDTTYILITADSLGSTANTDGRGYYLGSRVDNTNFFSQKNTIQTPFAISSNYGSGTNNNYIGARNAAAIIYSNKECAYGSLGTSLTTAEGLLDRAAVQALETSLFRQV